MKLLHLTVLRILIFLAVIPATSWCQTIFVSPSGNDKNPGTKYKPVQTFARAQELVRTSERKSGADIIFSSGIYYLLETIVFTSMDGGDINQPVKYQAEAGGTVIISGGSLIKPEWKPYKNGIFKALVPSVEIDQLYINGQRQRMARFPNVVAGRNVFDTWDLIPTPKPDTLNDPLNKKRIASWSHPDGAYIHAMHDALWGGLHWLVKGKNPDSTLILEGGWQNNRPSKMHPRYRIVENVFEELDSPGEWYYSSKDHILYYFPEPGTDLSKATVEVVRLKHLIDFRGSKEKPVRGIRLEGLTFRHTARTFMETREQILRSDWTMYRGGAVVFNGAEDCAITGCEFDQLGGNSVFVNNYNRRILIKSCYIHDSGANGVAFLGDPASVRSPLFRYGPQDYEKIDRTPGPIGDNFPEDCRVEDCLITLPGRYEKQTAAVQISMSHKITVTHCTIYDTPRSGINISEGTFGGHIIEFCDVFNTVLETGDHGSFNSWGRDRYWTPDIIETATEVKKNPGLAFLDMLDPNIIRNSRWRCDHGWDIDLDDGSSWYRIYNNICLNGGLKMREGYNRIATNNIIINNSLHPHVWFPGSGDIFAHNIVYGAYKPAIMEAGIPANEKWGTQLDSNLFATNNGDRLKFSINQADLNSLFGDPLFVDAANGDYRVEPGSPALVMGFRNFPTDEFGVVSLKLKMISKRPQIPEILADGQAVIGKMYNWYGATVRNVETLGDQSAAGLPEINGIILVSIPGGSVLDKAGLKVGDVILQCQDVPVSNFNQVLEVLKDTQYRWQVKVEIMRNQKKQLITF